MAAKVFPAALAFFEAWLLNATRDSLRVEAGAILDRSS
jgi:hypothetical protein